MHKSSFQLNLKLSKTQHEMWTHNEQQGAGLPIWYIGEAKTN